MADILKWSGQIAFYAVFAAIVGYFASAPAYHHFADGQALIKMTFTHGGEYKGGCRKRTADELKEIAPNMRKEFDCPRDRVPVVVELDLDGEAVYRASHAPSGLHGDGPSIMYKGFPVPAGERTIVARLRDTARETGYDYTREGTFTLRPGQLLVIQFRKEAGGFVFRE